MNEIKISDTLSYIHNGYNGEWEPVFHHPMDYYKYVECSICHQFYPVSEFAYKSGYRICSACHSRGWRAYKERDYVTIDEFRSKMDKIREVFGIPKTNKASSNEEEAIMPFHPQVECPVCHKLYDVPTEVYNQHKSGYRICAYCHTRGWCNEMQPFNFKEELNMPFGKTNFGELTLTLNSTAITRNVIRAMAQPFDIEKVIFNAPATIVKWLDGSKTVVKCGENDEYDPEKGLAMCFAKKALGNKGHYYETFKKWLPEDNNIEEILKDMFLKKMMNAFERGGETDGE